MRCKLGKRAWQSSLKFTGVTKFLCSVPSCSVISDSLQPHRLYSPWNSPGQNTGLSFPSPGDLPNLGIEPQYPSLQLDSLPGEPQGKPKKIGVGCLSFFQGIFLTQESNWGLLHCRWILYQLSYEGSPLGSKMTFYSKLQREMSVFSSVWE